MVRGPKILGLDVWHERTPVSFLGTEWAANPVVRQSDIRVDAFLDSVGGQRYAARRDELLQLLEVDPQWHLSKISDGEKRRTQLVMGLMQPWEVLLLDEVTVDLDALSRSRLMDYLRRETETRQATVLYATHITQQMDGWPTHVSRMSLGRSEGQMRWPLEADAVSASLQTRLDDPACAGSQLCGRRSIQLTRQVGALALLAAARCRGAQRARAQGLVAAQRPDAGRGQGRQGLFRGVRLHALDDRLDLILDVHYASESTSVERMEAIAVASLPPMRKIFSATLSSVAVVSTPANAAQSFTTRPAPMTSEPRLTLPATSGTCSSELSSSCSAIVVRGETSAP